MMTFEEWNDMTAGEPRAIAVGQQRRSVAAEKMFGILSRILDDIEVGIDPYISAQEIRVALQEWADTRALTHDPRK